jgi:hypothetical protein
MNSSIPALVILLALAAAPADAKPRKASCAVKSAGSAPYRGPCNFIPDEKGSFSIEPIGRRAFAGGITSIGVWIVSPGVAEVRGLTRDGINSRWGEARRSRRDRACWTGSDFSVCVY